MFAIGDQCIQLAEMCIRDRAMGLRNALLANLERALTCSTKQEQQELLNIVIVGGGATGKMCIRDSIMIYWV